MSLVKLTALGHHSGMPSPVRLRLCGVPALLSSDGRVLVLDRHGALIAARLALVGPQPRAELAALLWPDASAARARANLRQRLLRLKALAGDDWLAGDALLSLAAHVDVLPTDAADAGELLAGVQVIDAEELQGWLDRTRQSLRQRRLQSLAALAGAAETDHRVPDALALLQQMVALEPDAEAHRRELMRLHYLNHDRAAALMAHAQLQQMLKSHFGVGVAPSAETTALLQLIDRSDAPSQHPAGTPVLASALASALARPPGLVGRDAERRLLAEQVRAGHTTLVFGEAGMGKTRLLADLPGGGAALVRLGARLGDAGVPYALFGRCLSAVTSATGVVPAADLQLELARLLPGLGPPPAGSAEPARLAAALLALLQQACGLGLRTVVVDDLQFADEASLALLTPLVGQAGCAWVLAMRPAAGPPAAQALAAQLGTVADTVCLHLAPLGADAVQALLDMLAASRLPGDVSASALLRRTGGNPLYLLETLKALLLMNPVSTGSTAESPAGTAWPRTDTVSRLIQQRLQRLSPLALKLARCAALAGADLCAPLVAEVLGLRPLDLADAWAELEAAQVLAGDRFAHDLIAEAAVASVPEAIAQPLHAEIAAWLERHDGEPVRLAGHWLAAVQLLRALPHLRRAAQRADALEQYADAARWHEQAAAILQDHGDRRGAFDAWFGAIAARSSNDEVDAVQRLTGLLDSLIDDDGQRAAAACAHVYLHAAAGRLNEARRVVQAALPLAQRAGLADIEVELLWDMVVFSHEAQRLPEALRYAEQAQARLAAVDPDTARLPLRGTRLKLAMAIANIAGNLGQVDLGRAQYLQARQIALEERQFVQAAGIEGDLSLEAIERGQPEEAARWAALALRSAERAHAPPSTRAQALAAHAVAQSALGDLGAALRAAEQAVQFAASAHDRDASRYAVRLALIQFALGRRDLAVKSLQARAEHGEMPEPRRAAVHAALLAMGLAADADAVLAQCEGSDNFGLRVRLLCAAQPGMAPERVLPLLGECAAMAQARGTLGLWLDLQAHRLAALRRAADPRSAALRLAIARETWAQAAAGVAGQELFPCVAAELMNALARTDAETAQVIALRASAWMQQAASTLPAAWRQNYLTRAPVLAVLALAPSSIGNNSAAALLPLPQRGRGLG